MWLINHLRLNRGKGLWPLGWDSQVLTPPGVVVWQRAAMSAVNSWSYLRLQQLELSEATVLLLLQKHL